MKIVIGLLFICCTAISFASNCPDPETSSLKWGMIPTPWQLNPFSAAKPQADDNAQFLKANILVAGYGQGVMCSYRTDKEVYSIWQQAWTKIPAPGDYAWIATPGGYVCTLGLALCNFYTA